MSMVRLGAFLMFTAVIFGSFGAHGLKQRLGADAIKIYDTGVFYHFVHGLAVLALAAAAAALKSPKLASTGWIFALGTVVFSGSLYALALGAPSVAGMIAPVGGLLLLLGWLCVIFA